MCSLKTRQTSSSQEISLELKRPQVTVSTETSKELKQEQKHILELKDTPYYLKQNQHRLIQTQPRTKASRIKETPPSKLTAYKPNSTFFRGKLKKVKCLIISNIQLKIITQAKKQGKHDPQSERKKTKPWIILTMERAEKDSLL